MGRAMALLIRKIISGGQTGVDRGALDAAIALEIPCAGWCPRGRRAEDGRIPARYPLVETDSTAYRVRTERNVRESAGTLVLCVGRPRNGTALTCSFARRLAKPLCVVDLADPLPLDAIRDWIATHHIHTLNVAGPRESAQPGIQRYTAAFIRALLSGARRARRWRPPPT